MKLRSSSYAHPGAPGKPSQDRLAVAPLADDGLLCVLSDGVGTARDPERCAERVVRIVTDNFAGRPRQWSMQKFIQHLAQQANESLQREGFFLDGTTSMQATLAVACLQDNRLFGLNVGDSPILLVREGETERLSRDHVAKSAEGPDRITQTIGMGPHLEPYYFERDLAQDDTILLTSDGLTKLLDDQALGHLANEAATARGVIQEVMQERPAADLDDLSAIMVRVDDITSLPPQVSSAPAMKFPQPAKGMQFEGYDLLNRMAGNDRVWLARRDGLRYVLKFVPQEAETDDSGIIMARFAREVGTATGLHGEFFVPARQPETGNPYYYVMDYVEAPSLRFLLKATRLSADETVQLGKFLCQAAQFLLRRELVHGDIKPDNILVFREYGEISFKLLDLGLASTVFTDASTSGTPSYLAPERFTGAFLSERTEVFSIGATLYEALTARPPFGAIERFQVPHHDKPARLTKWNANVPPWLECVILKSISVKKENRYQCYSELLFGLNHPESAPLNVYSGPLLERNPLLFYRTGFWFFVALSLLLTLILLCRP